MKKIITLLVVVILTGFTPKDYARTSSFEYDINETIDIQIKTVETIEDAYSFLTMLDSFNLKKNVYKDNVFDIVALNYKSKYLNFSNYTKQLFMDSVFSKNNIKYALTGQHEYGIPASVTLAQAYLESKKNGKYEFSNHVKHTNNLFGIKYRKNKLISDKYYFYTQEELTQKQLNWVKRKYKYTVLKKVGNKYRIRLKDAFAVFDGAENSFKFHNEILNRYDIEADTYYGWTAGLVDNGYATGSGYAALLNKIIQEYDLHELDYNVN